MQSEKYTQFSCPSCNEKSTFCAREIMNATQNPQLRQDVLSGKFYRWICPKCGKEATIVYPTLYHDMTNEFIVYHAPIRDNDGPIVVGGKTGQKKYDFANRGFAQAGYVLRKCFGEEDFREKVSQLDSGLDDRVIEVLKYRLLTIDRPSGLPDDAVLRFLKSISRKRDSFSYRVLVFACISYKQKSDWIIDVPYGKYEQVDSDRLAQCLFRNVAVPTEVSQFTLCELIKKLRDVF